METVDRTKKRRIALLRDKPVLVEVSPTRLLRCYYIWRAVVCTVQGEEVHELELTQWERLVSASSLLFLDHSKELDALYAEIDSRCSFRLKRKIYHWHLHRSGLLLLQADGSQQTVHCYVPRPYRSIYQQRQPVAEESGLWKLPLTGSFADLFPELAATTAPSPETTGCL